MAEKSQAIATQGTTTQRETIDQTAQLPQKEASRITGWLRRHTRLLSFIGALIVFGTFVVKEGFKDQLRDTVDSIEKAHTLFLLKNDAQDILQAIEDTKQQGLTNALIVTKRPKDDQQLAMTEVNSFHKLLNSEMQILDNGQLLLKQLGLPGRTPLFHYDNIEREIMRLKSDMWNDGAYYEKRHHLINDALNLTTSVQMNQREVLEAAQQDRERYERRYKTASNLSYFLYALGWGLGLMGRLVGVEAGSPD